MTLMELREKLKRWLDLTSGEPVDQLTTDLMTLDTLGQMLGTEFWLLLMYQQPCDPETLNRIANALERIEKKMMPSY